MAREAVIDALVTELERALTAVRAAQRMAAELQRAPVGRPSRARASAIRAPGDLRYGGMTVTEAAVALGVGEEHVRRLLRRGDLVGVPYGGTTGWRLPRDYVLDLQKQIESAREGKDAARRRLLPGSRPAGRPRKSQR